MTSGKQKEVKAAMKVLQQAMLEGMEPSLKGFGRFELRRNPARKGRNPKSGESIDIPEKTVVKFSPTLSFKKAVMTVVPQAPTPDDEDE